MAIVCIRPPSHEIANTEPEMTDRPVLDEAACNLLFREARSHNGWLDEPVGDEALRSAFDIAKMGPTSANCSPMRIIFSHMGALRAMSANEHLRDCKICCTRKTIPNFRVIQKYAIKLGGGINHRFNLSDEYLIKDNHIASLDIKNLISSAVKNKKGRKITVEVDNLNQLKKILGLKFNAILFDNMSIKNLKVGVKLAKKYYTTEASGNINLKSIKKIASTGIDRISIGSITHSVPAIDLKLEI